MPMFLSDIIVRAGWAKSKSEARRHIEQKGIKINDCLVCDPQAILISEQVYIDDELQNAVILCEDFEETTANLTAFKPDSLLLSFGKKKKIRIVLEE